MNKNNLIHDWYEFRKENLSILNFEDKKHIISYDKHLHNILKNVNSKKKNFVKKELFELDIEYSNYLNYWNEKFYDTGFKDALNLLLYYKN